MRNLKTFPQPRHIGDCQQYLNENAFTIFEKIEFSDISKEVIKAKLHDLITRQVPERTVLLNADDDNVTLHWFKNWLHPNLNHFFRKSPKDKRGCSRKVIENDMAMDSLHFYENGQQNFQYTLDDIKEYVSY